jgi:superoxide dismutase, Cu-Zn family
MEKVVIALLFIISITACAQEQERTEVQTEIISQDSLIAVIHPTEGSEVEGIVTFSKNGNNVDVSSTVTGLNPESMHGFHIHEYGDCSASDGTSAGGHYYPKNMPHGAPTDASRHMGDMGNLVSNEEGVAILEYTDNVIELEGLDTILGRGIIVHAGEDDLETQPTGNAGARIGCGVIGVAQN